MQYQTIEKAVGERKWLANTNLDVVTCRGSVPICETSAKSNKPKVSRQRDLKPIGKDLKAVKTREKKASGTHDLLEFYLTNHRLHGHESVRYASYETPR